MTYLAADHLEAGLDHIRSSPKDNGRVELIARRPADGERDFGSGWAPI